ncbi:phage recombination protein Bet [Uliginosibacterium sp. 31-12]|uniref:phage recombination protein Bet n=1 Tax=Uliginosibacterium sp. 31-12 TaxID=3062781 RepID=UPI0026E23DA5|nr:phage recombination protein Bet [Uliginosibacterium sp. 31-12]MDO6385619.1 phage recombination protein Bet [Uliginosibacterium sp. 31-12]
MSNLAIAPQTASAIPALMMDEQDLAHVLQTSLYPGAAMPSIKMVVAYCRAAQLDPMQKPVHIVPMWDKNSKSMRDVIMPGVGLYRTQAARSGEYAGMSEPEFGPDVTEKVGGIEMTYPKWCKVTVRRLLPNGIIVDFPAVEYWKENYATAGKDSEAPNAMWKKRPYGQIAKCAEAQALRKAFPEIGSQPTAEEMEGKEYQPQAEPAHAQVAEVVLPDYSEDQLKQNLPAWQKAADEGKFSAENMIAKINTRYTLSAAQQAVIRSIKPHTTEQQPASDMADHADFVAAMDQE